jgi:F-type H+-transporting ATPase subunit b
MRVKATKLTTGVAVLSAVAMLGLFSALFAAPETAPAVEVVKTEHVTPAVHAGGAGEAAHEEGDPAQKELDLGTMIFTICVFVGLFVVLKMTAWKPIMTGLKSREKAIRDSIEAAQRAKADAERTTKELEAKMADVQREASQQLMQAKQDAMKIADTIRLQAEAESASLKERTLREIEAAKQQALSEINTHAATLGTAVARKILQRQVNADDQERLVEESLAELAKKN